jgi:V/A-type H+/Na+-transporting ATPase subunit F
MSKSIAALGTEEFVLGFRLAGLKRTEGVPSDEFPQRLERLLADREVGILIVNARDLDKAPPALRRRATESIDPVVIQIGEASSDDLREKVKRAIGIDLYKEG